MSNYFIGDIHGHYFELNCLLSKINFNPKYDVLWSTGDLVSRGSDSLKVLRLFFDLGNSAKISLGNHDLWLLINYFGKNLISDDYLSEDIDLLMFWLREQPFYHIDNKMKVIMSHAGIFYKWDLSTLKKYTSEVKELLLTKEGCLLILELFKRKTKTLFWNKKLNFDERIFFTISSLTRMRYCYPDGSLDFMYNNYPKDYKFIQPWFSFKNRIPSGYKIIFGHWSDLNGFYIPGYIYNLDTGCCWGRKLTVLDWEEKKFITTKCNV